MQIPRQNIDINRLNTFGIFELRNLARALSVQSPTTLLREELIEQIKKQLRSDTAQAPQKSARGRPPRTNAFNIAQILEPDPHYENILEVPDDAILSNTFCARSATPITEQSRTGTGFLHTVPRGHGVLISSCLNTYHVPMKLITANRLDTGDHLEIKAVWNEQEKRYAVDEILKIGRIGYDNAESVRPHTVKRTGKLEFKLGNRIIIQTPKIYDRIEHIAQTNKAITDTYKIALLIEETDDCVDYLRENGIDEIYLIKVNFGIKKQIMLALTSLFNAKLHAKNGKDVILYIDNLNKLFKLYNTSIYDKGSFNVSQINLGPLTDLKTFFMSSKQLKEKGSLTIITYANEPPTDSEVFVTDEFNNLTNVCHSVI